MWPSFTVKVLQDTDFWQIFTQILSSTAIIIAAVVAASYSSKKYRDEVRAKKLYVLAMLTRIKAASATVIKTLEEDDANLESCIEMLSNSCIKQTKIIDEKFIEISEYCSLPVLTGFNGLIVAYRNLERDLEKVNSLNWYSYRESLMDNIRVNDEFTLYVLNEQKLFMKPYFIRKFLYVKNHLTLKKSKKKTNWHS